MPIHKKKGGFIKDEASIFPLSSQGEGLGVR
jgi:hypothetical protein